MNAMEGEEKIADAADSKPSEPEVVVTPKNTAPVPVSDTPIPPPKAPEEKPVSKPTEVPAKRAEDFLFSGNAVAEAAEKKAPLASQIPQPLNASPRALREVGLAPRTGVTAEAPSSLQSDSAEGAPRIAPIRTYAADISEVIRKRGETLSTIVRAEQEKGGPLNKEKETEYRAGMQRALLIAGAAGLVLLGIAIIGLVLIFSGNEEPAPEYAPLISANTAVSIPIQAEANLLELLAAERVASDINLGEVAEVVISEGGARLSPSQILTLLNAPPTIARNATDIMVGIHAFNRNQPFLLIEVEAYDRAFEAMLAWEPSMAENLGAFFAPNRAIMTPPPATLSFADYVYQNVDVRASDSSWQIVYAFPERNLLLITTNDSTLREVMTRLSLSGR